MSISPVARHSISTARLVLRPSGDEDADQAIAIRSDWEVSRMLRMAKYPVETEEVRNWFARHPQEWAEGSAYRFAILLKGRMVGLADIECAIGARGVLGYWLERAAWGHGYASEAAHAAVRFAFEILGLSQLTAAHVLDNVASGRVLHKLGFQRGDIVRRYSYSRREDIFQRQYVLNADHRSGSCSS